MNQYEIKAELNRICDHAVNEGLPLNVAVNFASGTVHEQLSVIVSEWQNMKMDQLEQLQAKAVANE